MNTHAFIDYLQDVHVLSSACFEFIAEHTKEEQYTKNQIIVSEGQITDRLWFVERGFTMGWYYKNGEKKPYRFWASGDIMVNVSSFFLQLPSRYNIEILENSTLLSIDKSHVQSLLSLFPEMDTIIFNIMEDQYHAAEKKVVDLLTLAPTERYNQLVQNAPEILQKTSVENIAAYLGISRKTLNRIRKKKIRKQT